MPCPEMEADSQQSQYIQGTSDKERTKTEQIEEDEEATQEAGDASRTFCQNPLRNRAISSIHAIGTGVGKRNSHSRARTTGKRVHNGGIEEAEELGEPSKSKIKW